MTVTSRTSTQDGAQLRPVWPPPRQPLPPHRLAKLANALGVSTPLPATGPIPMRVSPITSSSISDANLMFRSPTPSASSVHTVTTSMTSKFLLHVVPPKDLAQAADESQYTPLPVSASGYHSQYERGTLVPLHQSFHGQLMAIAKEYALPSTLGLVLYLVSSTPGPNTVNPTPNRDATLQEWEDEGQGPRISEAIWKHIWIRVLKVESGDSGPFSSRAGTPDVGFIASQSSPSLLDSATLTSSLKPLVSTSRLEILTNPGYPITPSPTTPSSSVFDLNNRSHSRLRSATALSLTAPIDRESSSSPALTEPSPNPGAIDLPGLHSNSFIPVLAKVEFVIDQARATWYEPWLRSRRLNHAKRAESRARGASFNNGETSEDDRRAPINLRLVDKAQAEADVPGFLRKNEDYLQLEDNDDDLSGRTKEEGESPLDGDDDDDELDDDEITAQFPPVPGAKDPLADVFGTDADAWAEIHADNRPVRKSDPNVMELALDGAALSEEPLLEENNIPQPNDDEEVKDLWEDQSRPRLSLTIPASPPSPALDTSNRRAAPPPLNLSAATPMSGLGLPMILTSPLPSSGDESASLAYLKDGTPSEGAFAASQGEELTLEVTEAEEEVARGPLQDKRDGAFFEDLDLGLSFNIDDTYDENDPNDRRRSQYLMKAKLDEIEKQFAQFSPRALKSEFTDVDQSSPRSLAHKQRRSRSSMASSTASSSPSKLPGKSNKRSSKAAIRSEDAAWPTVRYSALTSDARDLQLDTNLANQPQWTLNGVMQSKPLPSRKDSLSLTSGESFAKQRQDEALYPPLQPPRSLESPIIPLSPDPFGRYPSSFVPFEEVPPVPSVPQLSTRPTHKAKKSSISSMIVKEERTPSSRFSLDSTTDDHNPNNLVPGRDSRARSTSIVSVKNIRKFWRKSGTKGSISQTTPSSGKSSPTPPPNNLLPPTPSPNNFLPPAPSPAPTDTPQSQYPSLPPSRAPSRADSVLDLLRFDQDSKYPVHPNKPPNQASTTGPSPSPTPPPENKTGSVRKSILKSLRSGSFSQTTAQGDNARTSVDRSTGEPVPQGQGSIKKQRRPSAFESVSHRVRGSVSSTLYDLPPSPNIPEHFSISGNQPQRVSIPTNNTNNATKAHRASMKRVGPAGSQSSTDSSSPSIVSPVSVASPPRNNVIVRRGSQDSEDELSGLDNSQFELITPPKHGMRSSLSYPYHGLEH